MSKSPSRRHFCLFIICYAEAGTLFSWPLTLFFSFFLLIAVCIRVTKCQVHIAITGRVEKVRKEGGVGSSRYGGSN